MLLNWVKGFTLLLAFGIASMWTAVLADALFALIVLINAKRAFGIKGRDIRKYAEYKRMTKNKQAKRNSRKGCFIERPSPQGLLHK